MFVYLLLHANQKVLLNSCFFTLFSDNFIIKIIFFFIDLNKRLDTRVDDMISNGLLKEIEDFKKDFESKFSG